LAERPAAHRFVGSDALAEQARKRIERARPLKSVA